MQPPEPDREALVRHLRLRGFTDAEIAAVGTGAKELSALAWSAIFGLRGDEISLAQASAEAAVTLEAAESLLRAAGVDPSRPLRQEDAETLQLFGYIARLLGDEQAIQVARVMGQSLSRVADAFVAAARVNVEGPVRSRGVSYTDFLDAAEAVLQQLLPRFAHAMDRLHRLKLLDASYRSWWLDPEGAATLHDSSVGFADLAGFTARTRSLASADLAREIDRFEGRVTEKIGLAGGRVAKFIGDEVMFVADSATAACQCAWALLRLATSGDIPDVRIGLACGSVLTRYGDHYGMVVNIAKRLADVARTGMILVTEEISTQASSEFTFERMGAEVLKGLDEPVELYRLVR